MNIYVKVSKFFFTILSDLLTRLNMRSSKWRKFNYFILKLRIILKLHFIPLLYLLCRVLKMNPDRIIRKAILFSLDS